MTFRAQYSTVSEHLSVQWSISHDCVVRKHHNQNSKVIFEAAFVPSNSTISGSWLR